MNYPIEISPPDIKPWKTGNTGVDYVHVFDSGKPGPNGLDGHVPGWCVPSGPSQRATRP